MDMYFHAGMSSHEYELNNLNILKVEMFFHVDMSSFEHNLNNLKI